MGRTSFATVLCEFRRSYVRATKEPDITALIKELEKVSPDFKNAWQQQDIHGSGSELRQLHIEGVGTVAFEHSRLTIDEDRHLQMIYYAAQEGCPEGERFEQWLALQ